MAPPQSATQISTSAANRAATNSGLLRVLGQLTGLAVAVLVLIALPAHLSGRLAQQPAQACASCLLYLAFFGGGTLLLRTLRHGRLAPARSDAQRATSGARLALLLFAGAAVPSGHFAAWWDPTLALLPAAAGSVLRELLPTLGYATMLAAMALNITAAAALGKARRRGWERRPPPAPGHLPCLPVLPF